MAVHVQELRTAPSPAIDRLLLVEVHLGLNDELDDRNVNQKEKLFVIAGMLKCLGRETEISWLDGCRVCLQGQHPYRQGIAVACCLRA